MDHLLFRSVVITDNPTQKYPEYIDYWHLNEWREKQNVYHCYDKHLYPCDVLN